MINNLITLKLFTSEKDKVNVYFPLKYNYKCAYERLFCFTVVIIQSKYLSMLHGCYNAGSDICDQQT